MGKRRKRKKWKVKGYPIKLPSALWKAVCRRAEQTGRAFCREAQLWLEASLAAQLRLPHILLLPKCLSELSKKDVKQDILLTGQARAVLTSFEKTHFRTWAESITIYLQVSKEATDILPPTATFEDLVEKIVQLHWTR